MKYNTMKEKALTAIVAASLISPISACPTSQRTTGLEKTPVVQKDESTHYFFDDTGVTQIGDEKVKCYTFESGTKPVGEKGSKSEYARTLDGFSTEVEFQDYGLDGTLDAILIKKTGSDDKTLAAYSLPSSDMKYVDINNMSEEHTNLLKNILDNKEISFIDSKYDSKGFYEGSILNEKSSKELLPTYISKSIEDVLKNNLEQ